MTPPLLFTVQAPSGTGKTTLIEALIKEATGRGLSVGALKHAGHPHTLDKPGSDSHRFRGAGAVRSVVANSHTLAMFEAPPTDPRDIVQRHFGSTDLVIAEGWRGWSLPTIRLTRGSAAAASDWSTPDPVVAWVVSGDAESPTELPRLPLSRPDLVLDWVLSNIPPAPLCP